MAKQLEIPVEGKIVEEISQGMMYASLAITDNKEGTLKAVGRANPWQEEALRIITGSKEDAHKPLKDILSEDMDGLELDHEIDISGITWGGHFLDTQGYIAHNDKHIVLAFRCTTSAFDWLTNFNTTTSAWEIEEDLAQGFSGFCSGLDGLCCVPDDDPNNNKPRVHTGFYNNFLAALPAIRKHVVPLLLKTDDSEQPARQLYVVGHSLGAGVATLAACYFLTEFDWNELPHSLIVVTAGSPRACSKSMKKVIDAKRESFGFNNNARMYRVVKGKDVVTTVPPKFLGFRHLCDPIKITDDEKIVLCKEEQDDPESKLIQGPALLNNSNDFEALGGEKHEENDIVVDGCDSEEEGTNSKYDRLVAKVPKPLRDHMPDFYLKPMLKALGLKYGSTRPGVKRALTTQQKEEPKIEAAAAKEKEGELMMKKEKSKMIRWKIFGKIRLKSNQVQPVVA